MFSKFQCIVYKRDVLNCKYLHDLMYDQKLMRMIRHLGEEKSPLNFQLETICKSIHLTILYLTNAMQSLSDTEGLHKY